MRRVVVAQESSMERLFLEAEGRRKELPTVPAQEIDDNIPFEKLNPVQSAFYFFYEGGNALVSSSTSSGKSLVAYLFMKRHPGMKVYAVPLKALASEKTAELKNLFGVHAVEKRTGDEILKAGTPPSREILVCTYEYLSLALRNGAGWLDRVSGVVLDEIHMVFKRPSLDEIMSFLLRKEIDLLGLSATLPDGEKLARHMKAKLWIDSRWRPVPLETQEVCLGKGKGKREKVRKALALKALEEVERGRKVLIFAGTKSLCWEVLEELQSLGVRVVNETAPFERKEEEGRIEAGVHTADVPKEERERIEREFRKRDSKLGIVVATQTLAYGMNMPADAVIIFTERKPIGGTWMLFPDGMDVVQMEGRAGRMGMSEKGYSFRLTWNMSPEALREEIESSLLSPKLEEKKIRELMYTYVLLEVKTGERFLEDSFLLRYLPDIRNFDKVRREGLRFLYEKGFIDDGALTPKGEFSLGYGVNPEMVEKFFERYERGEPPLVVARPLINKEFYSGFLSFKKQETKKKIREEEIVEWLFRLPLAKPVMEQVKFLQDFIELRDYELVTYVYGGLFVSSPGRPVGELSYMEPDGIALVKNLAGLYKLGFVKKQPPEKFASILYRLGIAVAKGIPPEYAPLAGIKGLGFVRLQACAHALHKTGIKGIPLDFSPKELADNSDFRSELSSAFYRRALNLEMGKEEARKESLEGYAKKETEKTLEILSSAQDIVDKRFAQAVERFFGKFLTSKLEA